MCGCAAAARCMLPPAAGLVLRVLARMTSEEARVTVSIDKVGLCDAAALSWIAEVTGVEVMSPVSGDSTFVLSGHAQTQDKGQENPLTHAVELLLLHCAAGSLCTRSRYLGFTLWRLASCGGSSHRPTPDHPHLRIDPEATTRDRVFSALAAGVRGASRAALHWSPDALDDFVRALTSSLWADSPAHELSTEDTECRYVLAEQAWLSRLVDLLVSEVISTPSHPKVHSAGDIDSASHQQRSLEGSAEAPPTPPPTPESETSSAAAMAAANAQGVRQSMLQRTADTASAAALDHTTAAAVAVVAAAVEAEPANSPLVSRSGWDGGCVPQRSFTALYVLRWLMRSPAISTLVFEQHSSERLIHYLAHRALLPQRIARNGCECRQRQDEQ